MLGWLRNLLGSPQIAAQKLPSKELAERLALFQGRYLAIKAKYDAAQTNPDNRRHWANADALSARTANSEAIRKKLRERARYEAANNCYAWGMGCTLANDLIGTGPRLQVLLDNQAANRQIELAWASWARAICLAAKLRTLKQAKTFDGEGFGLPIRNDRLPTSVKLDLRLYECDHFRDPEGSVGTIRDQVVEGIRFDAVGNPMAYWFLDQHPGDAQSAGARGRGRWIPARNVLHWFHVLRPGQIRGVPEITPALPLFAQLRRYTLAALTAAETAADFAVLLKTQTGANVEMDQGEDFEELELVRGLMTTLPAGYEAAQMKGEQPTTTYDMFKRELLNEIARCLDMPYNVAAGNSSSYNYASGRLDHQTYFRSQDVERSELREIVLDPLLVAWLNEAVDVRGLLPAGVPIDDLPHVWHFDGREHVDPVKESTAQATRLQSNLTTLAIEYGRQGLDWREALEQRARELEFMRKNGFIGPATPPTSDPNAAGDDPDDDDPEERDDEDRDPEEEEQVGAAGLPMLRASQAPSTLRLCGAGEVELQAAEGEDGKKLRKFSMTAYTGAAMRIRGFAWPLVVDLEGVGIPSQRQPILRDHDTTQIVGHTESIGTTSQRLKLGGVISGVGAAAQEVLALADNGFPWQASIGANIDRLEFVDRGETVKVNGRTQQGPLYVVRASTLSEVSFVPIGADPATSAAIAATPAPGDPAMSFEQWLAANNFEVEKLSDAHKRILQAAWKAESNPPPPPNPTPTPTATPSRGLDQVIADRRTEEGRLQRIAELVAEAIETGGVDTDEAEKLGKLAVSAKWDPQKLDLELLRAGRPRVTGVTRSRSELPDANVIEAAVCMASRLPTLEDEFDERTLEAAKKRYRHGMGLQELILTSARRNGFTGLTIGRGNLKAALTAASRTHIEAASGGPSTYDLSGILSNVANKFLRVAFEAVESAWRMITAIRPVNDFKQITSYSLTGDMQYELVPPSGELKHGQVSQVPYTNRADTYGKLLGVDRRDIINDDLGALDRVGVRMGRGGALKVCDVFWAEFLNNGTFFTTGNGNALAAGAGTALSITSLQDLDRLFRLQTDPDGKPLGLIAALLLVPVHLRITAINLMASLNIVATTTANAPLPDGNPFAGAFEVVSSAYLSNATYTGFSTTAWYLLANPNDLPVMETVFLDGIELPTVDSSEIDIRQLGVVFRGFHDFGCKKQELRGGCRSPGA